MHLTTLGKATLPLILVAALFSACSTSPAITTRLNNREALVPDGLSRVVVGRPSRATGSIVTFDFYVDGVKAATIKNNEGTSFLVEEGKHTFYLTVRLLDSPVNRTSFLKSVLLRSGEVLYIELTNFSKDVNSPSFFESNFMWSKTPQLDYEKIKEVRPLIAAVYNDGGVIGIGEELRTRTIGNPAASQMVAASAPSGSDTADIGANQEAPKQPIFLDNCIAVVIGNKEYKRGEIPVAYAINDALAFKELLENGYRLRRENIWYLENAGYADLISIFGSENYTKSRIYRTVSTSDEPVDLVVYYSGHGAPATNGPEKGKGYLVPVDADLLALQDTGYSIDLLIRNLEQMKKDKLVRKAWIVIDACFSGQCGDGSLIRKNVSGIAVVPVQEFEESKDSTIMLASSNDEYASWYPEQQHGLFTYFLLQGLAGKANSNNDREISVQELEKYLRENVPRYSNRINGQEQNPQILTGDSSSPIRIFE